MANAKTAASDTTRDQGDLTTRAGFALRVGIATPPSEGALPWFRGVENNKMLNPRESQANISISCTCEKSQTL
jgi:hypothetical protein